MTPTEEAQFRGTFDPSAPHGWQTRDGRPAAALDLIEAGE